MAQDPLAVPRSNAALLAAVPIALTGVAVTVLGILVIYDSNPFGWFGVTDGIVMLALALAGWIRGDWALSLFGGMFVLSLSVLAAGVLGGADAFILVGVVCLIGIGCATGVTHQLGRVAASVGRDDRDGAPRG